MFFSQTSYEVLDKFVYICKDSNFGRSSILFAVMLFFFLPVMYHCIIWLLLAAKYNYNKIIKSFNWYIYQSEGSKFLK